MTRYALQGTTSGELLTYGGLVLVHHSADELAFLTNGAAVRPVPGDIPEVETLPISAHPDFAGVRFPIQRKDFR